MDILLARGGVTLLTERAGNEKDVDADTAEHFVAPERVRDQCRSIESLLTSNPEDECRHQSQRKSEQNNGGRLFEA